MRYAAFIPLRGGSKSIPRKNILPIGGKPLCQWVIEAASASKIDVVVVATDDAEIRDAVLGMNLPKVKVVGRSAETATDTASTESAMLEYARTADVENVILIQATSPLLTSEELDGAIDRFDALGADSLVSVVKQKRFNWSVDAAGLATPKNYDPRARPRRQDFDGYFVENGAFYITRRTGLIENNSRLYGKMVAWEMAEETFHELDEPVDWIIIEKLLLDRRTKESLFSGIKLVLTDVDGVLTDSGMYYSENGDELKKFNTRDGKGLELLRNAGIRVGILTSENTKLVERRGAKLKVDHLIQGAVDKRAPFENLLRELGLTLDEVAYIGDDLADVPLLRSAGFSACPSDAVPEAKAAAKFVCRAPGGGGCVREFAEYILARR